MTRVGLRISDGQAVAESVVSAMRKRLGEQAVVYGGVKDNAAAMKKMMGAGIETTIQDGQIAYAEAAEAAAPWRLQARFFRKSGREVIVVTCRKVNGESVVDEQTYTGKRFSDALESLNNGLPSFCPAIVRAADVAAPAGRTPSVPEGVRPATKTLKPWSPPPRRD
jgi:hypothetical protein